MGLNWGELIFFFLTYSNDCFVIFLNKTVNWDFFFQILNDQNKALQLEVQKLQTLVSEQVRLFMNYKAEISNIKKIWFFLNINQLVHFEEFCSSMDVSFHCISVHLVLIKCLRKIFFLPWGEANAHFLFIST